METKMPDPAEQNQARVTTADANSKPLVFTAREQRVLWALYENPSGVFREEIDRVAGASNGPAVILGLRKKLGHDAIGTELVESYDRDGIPVKVGRYRLTPVGRWRLAEFWHLRGAA